MAAPLIKELPDFGAPETGLPDFGGAQTQPAGEGELPDFGAAPDPEQEFRDAAGRGPGLPLPHDSLERAAQDAEIMRRVGTVVPPGYTPRPDPGVIKEGPSWVERLYQKVGLLPGGDEIKPNPETDVLARSGPSALLSVPARIAGTAGKVSKAALGDIAAGTLNTVEPSQEAADLGGNLKASIEGYPLPVERALEGNKREDKEEHNSGWQTVAADISLGLADLAPKVAMLEAAPGSSMSLLKAGASADIFGFGDKGEFSKKNAAFAAAFPFVTAGAASVTDKAIQAAVDRGFTWAANPGAQRALHLAANQAAMDAVMAAQEAPELQKLAETDPAEFKRELAKMIGSNLAFGIPEMLKQHAPADSRPQQPAVEEQKAPETPGTAPAAESSPPAPAPKVAPGIEEGKFGKALQGLVATEKADEAAAAAEPVVPSRDLAAELQAAMTGNQIKAEPEAAAEKSAETPEDQQAREEAEVHYGERAPEAPEDLQEQLRAEMERGDQAEEAAHQVEEEHAAAPTESPEDLQAQLQAEMENGEERPAAPVGAETVAKQGAPPEASEPVGTPGETVTAPAEEGKPQVRVARGLRARKVFARETEMGGPDILSWIADNMPMLSKTQARQQWGAEKFGLNKSLWDDAPTLQRPHHNTIYSPNGSAPDRVAQAAYNDGALSAPDVNELWAAVDKASKARSHAYEEQRHGEKILQNELEQHKAWRAAKDSGEVRVEASELQPGDSLEVQGERIKVTGKDPTTGDIDLEDGSKFGRQTLAAGDSVYVEKLGEDLGERLKAEGAAPKPAAVPDFSLDAPESVEEQKARLLAEAEAQQHEAAQEELRKRAAAPLEGSQGDLGQGDMLGGGDLFSAAPAAGEEKPKSWLDRAIEATDPLGPMKRGELQGVGLPVWITKTLANGTLRAVRVALRAGRSLAEAFQDGLAWLKDHNPPGFNAGEAEAWLRELAQTEGQTLALIARRNEVGQRLAEINKQAGRPGGLTKDLKGERYALSKEHLQIQRSLLKDPDYVADLARRMDQLGKDLDNARKAGDGAGARQAAEELQGEMSTWQMVDPVLRMRIYNDLVARGEIMKSNLGPLPQGRTLGELTNWLQARKLNSPRLSIRERLSLGRRLAEEWDRGKTALAKAADTVAAGWQAFKAQWQHPPIDTDFRGVIKDWLYQKQWTGLETHRWVSEIRDKVPSKQRRQALGVWIDAGGDQSLLQSQADLVPDKYRKIWETALKLTPDEKALGERIQSDFAQKLEDGLNVGLLKKGREDYGLPQLWNKEPEVERPYDPSDPLYKKPGSPRKATARLDPRDPFFSLERTVPSYFDGIMAKGEPKSLDAGDLVAHYNAQFHEALADRTLIKALKEVKAADGSPAVMISGGARIEPAGEGGRVYFVDSGWRPKEAVTEDGHLYQTVDHWALRDWKFASKTEDGNPVIVHGDFLVHPDYVRFLTNELGTSWVRNEETGMGKVFNPVLKSAAFLKASKFASATFHLATIGEHAMFHAVSPLTRGVQIDPARNPRLAQLMRAGLELGFSGPQSLFSEGLASHGGLWGHVPGLGDFMQGMSDYLFKDYIPKIKVKAGLAILARNEARYKTELTAEQICELTARQANAAFGAQPWRLMGTNKGWLDLNRLLLTAPDFLLSRSKVVGQALKPYNREQRYFLLAQAAVVYGVSRVLNQLLDGDPHWEPENALSVISGGRSYSARFLVNDIYHMLSDPVSFASGRLGPLVRSGMEMFYQRDMRTGARIEVPFKTNSGTWRAAQILVKDLAGWLIPVGMEGLLPGAAGREQTSMGQVALALVGIGSRKYTAQNQVAGWAADFNRKSPDAKTERHQQELDDSARGASDYRKLDALLDAKQTDQALQEYNQLLASGHDAATIARRYSNIARPFTGNRAREAAFRDSLSPAQVRIYDRALAEREARLGAFQKLQGKVAAPVGP